MIENILEFEEGIRLKPYLDSEGYPTIGIGTKIGAKYDKSLGITQENYLALYQIEITEAIAKLWLEMRLSNKRNRLIEMPWFMKLNSARQDIIMSMAYQMGIHGLLKFEKMIAAAKAENYDAMADEALDSKWAHQTPNRAERHAIVLRTGKIESVTEYVHSFSTKHTGINE